MTQLNTISLPDFVKLGDVIISEATNQIQTEFMNSGIAKIETMEDNTGDSREFTDVDMKQYASNQKEGEQAKMTRVQQGYSKIMKEERKSSAIAITYKMRHRNKYQDVVQKLTELAQHVPNRLEMDAQHRFTFGTATSYLDMDGDTVDITLGDGLSLFNTAHTITGSAATYRNRLAGNPIIARGSLEGMQKLIVEETFNNIGEKTTVPFDILWTTDDPETINIAREYLQATAELSAPNNGIPNVFKGKYRHVTLSRVATTKNGGVDTNKSKYWGLSSSARSSFHIGIFEKPSVTSPQANSNADDFLTDNWYYKTNGAYGIVITDGRFIKFSSGDGTA